MKRIFTLLAALIPLLAAAQYFTITPQGWKNAEDNSLDYVVVPLEGSQADLFQKAKTAVTASYKSAKDVMSFNEPDIININGYTDCLSQRLIGMNFVYGIRYTMQILFKDGKVRFNAPDAYTGEYFRDGKTSYFSLTPGSTGLFGNTTYMFDKKGTCKKKEQKKQVEAYFNDLIARILDLMQNGGAVSDDW